MNEGHYREILNELKEAEDSVRRMKEQVTRDLLKGNSVYIKVDWSRIYRDLDCNRPLKINFTE